MNTLQYPTLNPQSHCNGCDTDLGETHTLSCSTGGLVIVRHNEIRDKLLSLSRNAFTPASLRTEPLIHKGHIKSE